MERITLRKSFKRVFKKPLDSSSLYDENISFEKNYAEAKKYAQTVKTAYLGQIISVVGKDDSGETISNGYIITWDNDLKQNTLTLLGDGSATIQSDIKVGNKIIVAGTPVTDAIQEVSDILEEEINNQSSHDVISDDITYSGDTIVYKGETITNALQSVVNYVMSHSSGGIADIKTKDNDIFHIYNEEKSTYIDLYGIFNEQKEI